VGKYRSSIKRPESRHVRQQHPIWRGIGCLIIIIVPLISFALAYMTMPIFSGAGLVPYQLRGIPRAPDFLWQFIPKLAQLVELVISYPDILAYLTLTLVYTIFLGGFLSLVYSILYRIFGPSRYGPLDMPPPSGKVKKYKR